MPARDYYLPGRQLVSQNDAAMIPNANVPRSRFVGSWTRKTAFDAGKLYPILVDEVLPGDHLSYDITAYVRMSTPLFPLFDNQRIDTHFFFVPCRLVWENWIRFMGEQTQQGASIDYTIPQIVSPVGGFAVASIYDHMGIPVAGQINAAQSITVNALPFRAWNLIYNQWFRDENIQNAYDINLGNGPDDFQDYTIPRRGKAHDYFTSALPWPQKFTAPTVPLAGTAPITGIGVIDTMATVNTPTNFIESDGVSRQYNTWYSLGQFDQVADLGGIKAAASGGTPQIFADLTLATGVAINTFRQAFLVQQLLERDARGGTRYVELLFSHFGVRNPDYRLQRPEYIGGGSTNLVITPVAQTAPEGTSVVGALGAAGTAAGQHRASYAATEHGYIIGIISVRSELSYQQGLHKMWTRLTRYDFYWPSLAGLGEQAILQQEIYCSGIDAADAIVFGYQERWHEYRTRTSEVVGIMRSTAAGTIDMWHLSQLFAGAPVLNTTFIEDTPPMNRVLAAGAAAVGQQYLADILYRRTAVRPIPTFGTPVLLGRF